MRRTQQHFQAEIDRLELKLHFTFESVAWNELSAVIRMVIQRMCVWFLIRILQTFFSEFFFSYVVALFWQIFLCFLWIFDVPHKNSSAHTNEWMKYEIKNVAYLFRFVSVWGYSCCQSYIYLSFIFFVCFSCESCCLATVISIVFEHTINDVDNNWSVCDIRYFCFFFPALSLAALRRTTWHFI